MHGGDIQHVESLKLDSLKKYTKELEELKGQL